jgi:hypothetical protein
MWLATFRFAWKANEKMKWSVSYAEIEEVLAKLHGADGEVQKTTLRSRLKHLKRLGIPLDSKPGKGAKIWYFEEQFWQWALCLELAEFGLDPAAIAKFIAAEWGNLHPQFARARAHEDPFLFLVLTPNLMSAAWDHPKVRPLDYEWVSAPSNPKFMERRVGKRRRAIVINVSSLSRAMAHLETAYETRQSRQKER